MIRPVVSGAYLLFIALLVAMTSVRAEPSAVPAQPSPMASALATSPADTAFAAGDFVQAEAAYVSALRRDPNDFNALVRLGALHLYDGDLDGARSFIDSAASLQPESPRVAGLRATLAARQALLASLGNVSLPASGEASAPFVVREPLPLLSVSVNGHEASFMLDTGAPDAIIDPDFAKELGIAVKAGGTGVFAGGKTAQFATAVVDRFEAGGAVVTSMPVSVLPVRSVPFFPGHRVDGIVGTGFLAHFTSTIDYPHARLVLRARGIPVGAPASAAQRMWLVGDHFIFARGSVDALPEGLMLVDTGLAGGGFNATKSTIDAAHITLDTAHAGTGVGGGGEVQAVPFTVETLKLGTAVEHGINGIYTPEGSPLAMFPFAPQGVVSHQFLERFAVTFDFANMRLYLAQ